MGVFVVALPVVCLAFIAGYSLIQRHRLKLVLAGADRPRIAGRRRILLALDGDLPPRRTVDAALELGGPDAHTLVAMLPDSTPAADCLGPRAVDAIERAAGRSDIAVDVRVQSRDSYLDAICELATRERFDAVVVAAGGHPSAGVRRGEVMWLLEHVQGEMFVICCGRGG